MRFYLMRDLIDECRGYSDGYNKGKKDYIDGIEPNCRCIGSLKYKEGYNLGYVAGYNCFLNSSDIDDELFDDNFKVKIRSK